MNKIQKTFIFLIILFSVATLAYKFGDSRGYEAGYNEGYRYDCREEIAVLYKRVKAQGKLVTFAQESIKGTIVANDSLKRELKRKDSIDFHRQYSADSALNYKEARRKSDSIRALTGSGIINIYSDNGKFNGISCILDEKLRNTLPECKGFK